MIRKILFFLPGLLSIFNAGAQKADDRWWPVQTLPQIVIKTTNIDRPGQNSLSLQMLLQSVAGLAAKAVTEKKGKEMVWVTTDNQDIENWYNMLLKMHPGLKTIDGFATWDLIDHFKNLGIIKGYILYRSDQSKGEKGTYRNDINCSVNIATSLAGLVDGIIIDEGLEKEAKIHGLKLLSDVRDKTQLWCFTTYKTQFNRKMLCTQDPQKPNARDLAIAQKVFTVYGPDKSIPAAMEWLEPLSPILGWNCGDEFMQTDVTSSYGHIQTSTDWCMNLPVLMAGSENLTLNKANNMNPKAINWSDLRSGVSFISTDGDNTQWFEGNFFHGNTSYWNDYQRGKIPYGWSCCFAQLSQLCPQAIEYALSTKTPNDWLIEWGGGYYYPDHFGNKRANRWELFARQARRTWDLMQKTNIRVIGFDVIQYDSPEARKAYEIFASQTTGLLAIMVYQYYPYEGGEGRVFWVKDRSGTEIPVITARYALWEHANNRTHAGTPAKIAHNIQQTIEESPTEQLPRYDWVIDHVWSYFKKVPGNDENAENMPQDNAEMHGGFRGYTPFTWCAERLPANIRIMNPQEMIWRIRMKHNPVQTRKLIAGF